MQSEDSRPLGPKNLPHKNVLQERPSAPIPADENRSRGSSGGSPGDVQSSRLWGIFFPDFLAASEKCQLGLRSKQGLGEGLGEGHKFQMSPLQNYQRVFSRLRLDTNQPCGARRCPASLLQAPSPRDRGLHPQGPQRRWPRATPGTKERGTPRSNPMEPPAAAPLCHPVQGTAGSRNQSPSALKARNLLGTSSALAEGTTCR